MENLEVNIPFWQDRAVFVTGATGLVGSWLVKRLIKAEANVVCLIRDWVPRSEFFLARLNEHVNIVHGDINDQAALERILGEYEISTVIHLAAQTIVGIANRNPISTFETNIGGTWRLLEACRRSTKVEQVVIASSDKAYGDQLVLPYDENTPLQGQHPYDVSKSCADLLAKTYAVSFGLPVAITRCGNFYGGGDLNWNRIIPGTIRSILRGQRPVIRSDGKSIRDYFYVEDGAIAYMKLAECLSNNPGLKGEAFNFSNELQISVLELVEMILSIMDSKLKPLVVNNSTNEIQHQYLNAQKARNVLGWEPQFNLQQGINATISWYKDYFAKVK